MTRIDRGPVNLTLIASRYPFSGRVPLVPPILEYLAALTLREFPDAAITQVDANQQNISPEDIRTEIVAISAMTATITWAYRFADACRKRGVHVVLGGIHPTALPEEAALHADTVVIGEAESVWGEVLRDIRSGKSKKLYRGERLPLVNLPKPIDGKLKGNYRFRAFFTMRGCPYRCTFCSVRRFFGDTIRYRPIPDVVAEIESCAGNIWFNGDDNIWGGDVRRSTDLFNELAKGTKRSWYGFGDLRSVQSGQGARMLAAARESGLFSVWAGWESDDVHLRAFNASGKQGADRVAAVKMLQDAGIDVTLFVVLGGRQDSLDSFKRTLDLSEKMNVGIHPVLLTPLPGTELYEEYKEFLLPDQGWDSFIGVKSVFDHPAPDMSPVRRELEYHHLNQELFRFSSIVRRIGSLPRSGFPKSHLLSFMTQMPMKLAFSKAYDDWKSNLQSEVQETEAAAARMRSLSEINDENSVSSLWKKINKKARPVRGQKLRGFTLKIYGLSLVAITILHILHGIEPGIYATLDRASVALHFAEEFAFWALVPASVITIIMREIGMVQEIKTIRRIAGDKIDRCMISLKELAYSSMIGAGGYWAYACMVEVL